MEVRAFCRGTGQPWPTTGVLKVAAVLEEAEYDAQTLVHQVSDAIQPSHPLSSPSPAFSLSLHRVFSSQSVLHTRWPKEWSFSIRPSNEYSGLISFRIDWFDLLAVQRILTNLLQHIFPKL